jgi:SulP family sulfate permease
MAPANPIARFTRAWPRVTPGTLRADLLAGLIGAIVVLPQGIAYATLLGLPPEYGLYCAMVPTAVAALFGSSWHSISGPTNAISLVVFATLSPIVAPGSPEYLEAVLTLAFIVGVALAAVGLFRLGAVANFISHTVVVAFSAGIGILIATTQLGELFGMAIPRGAFLKTWQYFLTHLAEINVYPTLVAAITIAVGLASQRFLRRVPYPLVAVIAGGLAAYALDAAIGKDLTGIRTLGALPGALPPLSYPSLRLDLVQPIAGVAVAVTALCLIESISVARSIAVRSGQRIDANREFVGQGLSNLAATFFSGFPSCGSFNRSMANYEAGAKTPLAAAAAAGFLVLIVLAVAPLVAYLPYAAMAGVLVLIAWRLVDLKQMRHIVHARGGEATVLGVTIAATLLMHLDVAILFGVLLSLGIYVYKTSQPRFVPVVPNPLAETRKSVELAPGLAECPQLKLVRLEGGLYFGAVDHAEQVLERFRAAHPGQKHLLLLCKGVSYVDLAAGEVLAAEARRRREEGGGLYLHGLRPPIRARLVRTGHLAAIGAHHVFETKYHAIKSIFETLDREVCAHCSARIFEECQTLSRAGPDRT